MPETLIITAAQLLANDIGDGLRVTAVDAPRYGRVVLNANTITYTAPAQSITQDDFIYTVEDQYGKIAQARVTIDLTETAPPVAALIAKDWAFDLTCSTTASYTAGQVLAHVEGGTSPSLTSVGPPLRGRVTLADGILTYGAPPCPPPSGPAIPLKSTNASSSGVKGGKSFGLVVGAQSDIRVGDFLTFYSTDAGTASLETGWTPVMTSPSGRSRIYKRVVDPDYLARHSQPQHRSGNATYPYYTAPGDAGQTAAFTCTVFRVPDRVDPAAFAIDLFVGDGTGTYTFERPPLDAEAYRMTVISAFGPGGQQDYLGAGGKPTVSHTTTPDAQVYLGGNLFSLAVEGSVASGTYPDHAVISNASDVFALSMVLREGRSGSTQPVANTTDAFTYTVTDSRGETANATVSVTISSQ